MLRLLDGLELGAPDLSVRASLGKGEELDCLEGLPLDVVGA